MSDFTDSTTEAIGFESISIQTTAYYAILEPEVQSDTPPRVLLALHGYGQSCRNFIRNFAPLRKTNTLVVAPQGPNQFYWQQNPPKVGFTWLTSYRKEHSLPDLMQYLTLVLETVHERHPYDRDKIFVLGFSQGSVLGFRFAANGLVPIAGLIAWGADLPPDVAEQLPNMKPFPVLVVHGEDDPIMPIAKARDGETQLRDHGFPVETLYFAGGHELPEDQVLAVSDWLDSH